MSQEKIEFELPKKLDTYLGVYCKMLQNDKDQEGAELIANAKVSIDEATSYDNWDGGTYGHTIRFSVSQKLFLKIGLRRESIQTAFCDALRSLISLSHERIDAVIIDLGTFEEWDWRGEIGLAQPSHLITEKEQHRIWNDGAFKIFLSHKSECKAQTAAIKEKLKIFGASCFVAHEDIHPTEIWQNEIKNALCSMDILVAFLSSGFYESDWTGQEVGFALGRKVPVIPVKIEQDPKGFIGAIQALKCTWEDAGDKLLSLLAQKSKMIDSYITRVSLSDSFDKSNMLADFLPHIQKLNSEQEQKIVAAYNENVDVHDSYGFNGTWISQYGFGLVYHLRRITGKNYVASSDFKAIRLPAQRPY